MECVLHFFFFARSIFFKILRKNKQVKRYFSRYRFSTTAKKVLPRNTDFICGNQTRTANPHKWQMHFLVWDW